MKNIFTVPKLSKASASWYVHFRFNGKQYRLKENINRIADLKEREQRFDILARFTHQELKKGWNPETPALTKEKSILTVIQAFDLTLKNRKELVKNDTYLNHVYKIKRIKESIIYLGLENTKVVDLKSSHYETILDKTCELYKLTNSSYNRYKVDLSAVLNSLVDLKILKSSFHLKIKNKKTVKKVAHVPASHSDIEKIKTHLKTNHPNFFIFWATMFHTGIRRNELLRVRLNMIDLNNDSIYLSEDITKTGIARITPVNEHLKPLLEILQFDNLPKDYFLFGSHDKKYKKKDNESLNFTPAPNQLRSWVASNLWKNEIKTKLGIDMSLYAIKKHGANEKILAGLSVDALRELFGHTSEVTTQIYITNLKEINRKEILQKSPDI